uniref:Uncharacterized protein n=1 Tax=Cercocebus atys TaxID=9531 RepID=A0A2K5MU10_CERAT
WTHLEVLRIHMQLVTVQLTQLGKGALEIIQVLYGISQGSQHLLAVCLDAGVAHDGRGRGQVAKAVKEPLGPWVDNQDLPSQGFSSSIFHIHLAPQACDTQTRLVLPPPDGPSLFTLVAEDKGHIFLGVLGHPRPPNHHHLTTSTNAL